MSKALTSLRQPLAFRSDEIASRQCRLCFDAFEKTSFDITGYACIDIHEDKASLHMSASSGCTLCSFIARLYSKEVPPQGRPTLRFYLDKDERFIRNGLHAIYGSMLFGSIEVEIRSTNIFEGR